MSDDKVHDKLMKDLNDILSEMLIVNEEMEKKIANKKIRKKREKQDRDIKDFKKYIVDKKKERVGQKKEIDMEECNKNTPMTVLNREEELEFTCELRKTYQKWAILNYHTSQLVYLGMSDVIHVLAQSMKGDEEGVIDAVLRIVEDVLNAMREKDHKEMKELQKEVNNL